jgi:hypothetical protein
MSQNEFHQTHSDPSETKCADMSLEAASASLQAAADLASREESATEEIQTWLEDMARQRFRLDAGSLGIVLLCLMPYFRFFAEYYWEALSWPLLMSMGSGLAIPFLLLHKIHRLQRQQEADLALGPRNKYWLRALVEALEDNNAKVRTAAARVLTPLLSRLKPEDTALLRPDLRSRLYFVLRANRYGDRDLIVAILRALGRLGVLEARPAVEELANSDAWLPYQRRVKKEARACLAALESYEKEMGAGLSALQGSEEAAALYPGSEQEQAELTPEMQANRAAMQAQLASLLDERSKRGQPAMRLGFLIASWSIIVPYTGGQGLVNAIAGNWLEGLVWFCLSGMATQLHRITLTANDTKTARELAGFEDVRVIGTLAEALEWPDAEMRHVAALALIQLLPKMRASDAGLLTASQRGCLYRLLKPENAEETEELLLAILTALEQVGDEKAVPYVQSLANHFPATVAQKRVTDAAIQCLPYLEERVQQNRFSQTLLRSSQAEEVGADVLLRPAQGGVDTDPQVLLRASVSDNASPGSIG